LPHISVNCYQKDRFLKIIYYTKGKLFFYIRIMKPFLNLVLLFPLLLYVLLLLINIGPLATSFDINIFWLFTVNTSVIVIISFFFIWYLTLLWLVFKFSSVFSNHKNKKLTQEVSDLKAKLADGQAELIAKITSELKAENDKKLELYKKENSKMTWNVDLELWNIKKKLDKLEKLEKEKKEK
jgi:hypothetical protein